MWNLIRWVSPRTIKETFVPPTDYRYPFMAPGRRLELDQPSGAITDFFPFAGEEEQVDHLEASSRGPSDGVNDSSRTIENVAPLHRPVERLRDEPRAHALQLAAVELRLAQEVEPERRPLQEPGSLLVVRLSRLAPLLPSRICAFVSVVSVDALALQERPIC